MRQDRLRVLLVEHDNAFARYVAEMLGQADLPAEVVHQGDLAQGLEALWSSQFEVVLMGLGLPDGAGLGNLPLVRWFSPLVSIIVTGESDDKILALEAIQAGANDYLIRSQLTPGWVERSIHYALERRRMDQVLMEAEEQYHQVFDHLVEGIFQTTPDGHYRMANAALARIYGYATPEELISGLTDIGSSLYVEKGRRSEFVALMQGQDIITGFESQVYRKDGTVIWISENCRAVRDVTGGLIHYEGTVEDITQRKEAEEKLRHSEALYHSLVETLPQNIFRKSLEGRFTFANQKFCETLGRPLSDIVGKTDHDFFPREMAEKYQRDDRQVLETGKPYSTVEEHKPPGSGTIYVQVVKTPIREVDGRILGLQGIFWDITRQRMAEEKIRRSNLALAQSRRELRARNQQMEEDLKMAREIQLTMLPQQYPAFPHGGPESESAFQFTHRYLPTGSVGGDFFTVSALSETQASVFLCDVAGHGVRSALVTAMIRALVEELKPVATQPGEFLTKLNGDLCTILRHTGTPLLTTAFYLVADWRTGAMRYANAGHPKPLHLRRQAGEVVSIANAFGRSQTALGLMENARYDASEIGLASGDTVLLFTDGLVEVQNVKGDLYTAQLLKAATQARLQLPSAALLDGLLAEIRAFADEAGFTDDVCLVGLDLTSPPQPTHQ
jgi:phosphoserine phosphatase RsbU/P